MEINANPEKSDRPVDSHEEWARFIELWLRKMYIWSCRLRRGDSHAQKRGRTTHSMPRGDGGVGCPPRAAHRPPARHLCR